MPTNINLVLPKHKRLEIAALVLLLSVFAAAYIESRTFPTLARLYPYWIARAGLVATTVAIISIVLSGASSRRVQREPEKSGVDARSTARYVAWFIAFPVTGFILGLTMGGGAYIALFLRREAHMAWWRCAIAAAAWLMFMESISRFLRIEWPPTFIDYFL